MKAIPFFSGVFIAGLFSTQALAFSVFPLGGDQALKWGDNTVGSAGGVVAWSFIPAGTAGSAFCGDTCPGVSSDALFIENSPGGGFTPTPLVSLESYLVAAMDKWAVVANISFVKLSNDSGVPINDPAAVPGATGQIRIGAFDFASGGGAVGYAPPPNGGTGAGDILFDSSSYYQFALGSEGGSFDTSFAPNDFETLLLHELGHTLGLAHPVFDGTCPVMQVGGSCYPLVNRELDADDIAGIQFLYGAAPVPEADSWAMLLTGLGLVGFAATRRRG